MDRMEILREMADYTELLRQNARRDSEIERTIVASDVVTDQANALAPLLDQRRRDYGVMLWMMRRIERVFRQGGDWLGAHRRLWAYRKEFDKQYAVLDQALQNLFEIVKREEKQ